jgi:DNA-binding NtrC family response regulator
MKFNVLIVDDEKNIREGLGRALELEGYEIHLAEDGRQGWNMVNNREIDLVIADLRMPEISGEELLKRITSSYPTVPVIILTGHGTIESAVEAMRNGAYDFVTKPVDLDHLALLIKRALSNRELVLQHRTLQQEVERLNASQRVPNLIGKSSEMQRVLQLVKQVADTRASVIITGESGVGKEVVADAIHHISGRREQPYIKVHCAALTESLLESELFGHEKGAFTGAVARKRGRFELANGGTIFLDEIGEISQQVQIKILRVLQDKKFERVGGEQTFEVDVRIISATNKDLKQEIEAGRFREDLYYRLNVVNIHVPPLRERKEDIPLLAHAFLEEFSRENKKEIEAIDRSAMQALHNYTWPGNIRELRNCIESAVVMAGGSTITPADLPPQIAAGDDTDYVKIEVGTPLEDAEKEIIQATLNRENGNKTKTADVLGIGRKTLHRKIQEYGIEA